MEKLFKNISLEDKYKEAHEEAVKELGLNEEDAKVMEGVVGLIQTIANVEKLPLQLENAMLEAGLEAVTEEARKLKAKVNALEEANKKLQIENNNLLGSLKAMKELSIADDRIEAVNPKVVTLDFRR